MLDLISAGGVFMWPIVGLAVLLVLLIVRASLKPERPTAGRDRMLIIQLGVFTFFLSVLSQAMGLIQMLQAIESIGGGISPALLAGGLRVSMIAPVFGLVILLVALAVWAVLGYRVATPEG